MSVRKTEHARTTRTETTTSRRVSTSVAAAYERMWSAIVDHSLPPGTRLVEDQLCEAFGIGRTRVRQLLQRLAHEHVVTLTPNRGAIVSKPSVRRAQEVFEVRSVLETAVVSKLLDSATRADKRRIREHVQREKAAWQARDRRSTIKLSGEFHLILAMLAGNELALNMLRELVSQSSLIIAVYQAPGTAPCPPDEHERLCEAIESSDRSALRLMQQHLQHVLDDLKLVESSEHGVDLVTVLTHAARPS
jgi:DNA-binding GntR family transcriptional regulator